ncbi:MAG: hypothetical protein PHV42_04430, partial [Candidatus Pacebacteria bacterium]|nr:hypothetical protein [Candidatus Paceibacterota bacterium]
MVEGGPRIIRSAESVPDGPDSRAVEIAGEGKYVDILETVRKEGFLEKEMNRVREEYGLDELSFLNDADREMFTVLDLYDPVTAKHCLRTYEIAREKMEKEVIPGESLAQLLEKNESITPEQFYRACLFHDIGKVEVPRVVIQHRMSEGHMLECMHHLYHEGKILGTLGLAPSASDTEIDDALKEHSLRSIDIVPAREVLSPEELAEVQHFGYSGDETLMDIIKTHEVFSGEILKNAGYTLESK